MRVLSTRSPIRIKTEDSLASSNSPQKESRREEEYKKRYDKKRKEIWAIDFSVSATEGRERIELDVACIFLHMMVVSFALGPAFDDRVVHVPSSHLAWPSSLCSMTTTSNRSSCCPLEK